MIKFLKRTRQLALTLLRKEGWDYPIWMAITLVVSSIVCLVIAIGGFVIMKLLNIPENYTWVLGIPLMIPCLFLYSWILLCEWFFVSCTSLVRLYAPGKSNLFAHGF